MPLPGGRNFAAEAVDPTGRHIAGGDGKSSAMLWDNGNPRAIELPTGLSMTRVAAVNTRGTVLGNAQDSAGKPYPWVYRDGKVTKLPNVDGEEFAHGSDINTAGDIVGSTAKRETDPSRPVIWPANGSPRILDVPAGNHSATANIIRDDGTIAGNISDGKGSYVLDSNGLVVKDSAGNPVRTGGMIFALSGDWAAGWVEEPGAKADNTEMIAAAWNIRTGELFQYRHLAAPAVGVSATGDIVTSDGVLMSKNGKQGRVPEDGEPGNISAEGMSHDGRTIVGSEDGAVFWRC